jgi:hypothetical protein
VADAVAVEPVSTPKFPANREKNRDFFNFGPDRGLKHPMRPMIPGAFKPNSLLNGTGNFLTEQEFRPKNREFKWPIVQIDFWITFSEGTTC